MKQSFLFYQLILALLAINCSGCSHNYCEPVASDSEFAPEILDLFELNSKQQQALSKINSAGDDPWLVVAQLVFSDMDGDLGRGKVSVSLNGKEAYQLDVATLFAQRGLEPNATSGKFALPFRLVPQKNGSGGSAVMYIGVALIDQAGHVSNCQSLDVEMNF